MNVLPKPEQPLLTVVTVVRNGMPYIKETLQSVLAQTVPIRVMVIDDNSTDETPSVVQSFPNVTYLKNTSSPGQAAARNQSLDLVTTPYVAWLDADDLWEPRFAECVISAFEKAPEAVMVTTGTICIDAQGRKLGLRDSYQRKYLIPDDQEDSNRIVPGDHVEFAVKMMRQKWAWCAHAFRTEVVRRAGAFNPKLVYSVDYDVVARVLTVGKAVHVPANLTRYRRHSTSVTHVHRPETIYGEKLEIALRVGSQAGVLTESEKRELELVSRFKCAVTHFIGRRNFSKAFEAIRLLFDPRLFFYWRRVSALK